MAGAVGQRRRDRQDWELLSSSSAFTYLGRRRPSLCNAVANRHSLWSSWGARDGGGAGCAYLFDRQFAASRGSSTAVELNSRGGRGHYCHNCQAQFPRTLRQTFPTLSAGSAPTSAGREPPLGLKYLPPTATLPRRPALDEHYPAAAAMPCPHTRMHAARQ